MLKLSESTRNNPASLVCDNCGKPVQLIVHHDYAEAHCCDKGYQIKMDGVSAWNCCSSGDNIKAI